MEFTATIDGGLKSVGGGMNGQIQYFGNRQVAKKIRFAALRVGEIVFGEITGIIQNELAYVKLPIGTFSAVIHKRIRQGDQLYLKVEEVSPDLILKVHSVSTKYTDNALNISEIIRILDLPDDEIIYDIVDILRKESNRIVKNDVLLTAKNIYNILPSFDKNTNIDDLLKIAVFLKNANIDVDLSIVRSLLDGVYGERTIANLLNKFIELAEKMPINSKNKLLSIFEFSNTKYFYIEKSLQLFSDNKDIDSLITFCQKIISITSTNNTFLELQKVSKQILRIFESQSFWNNLAVDSKNKIKYFQIFNIDHRIFVVTIAINTGQIFFQNKKSHDLSKNIEFNAYNVIKDKFKNIHLFADSFSSIEEFAIEIRSLFNTIGIEISSLYYYDEIGQEIDLISREFQQLNNKFSVVV